jgi:hypothetical protein
MELETVNKAKASEEGSNYEGRMPSAWLKENSPDMKQIEQ